MADLEPRRDGPYEAPLERLAAGRGQRRRALVAILSIGIVLFGAIGLARLSEITAAAPETGRGSTGPATSAGPTAEPSAPAFRSVAPRTEHLLDAPNDLLADAPSVLLFVRDGLAIGVERWTAGMDLAPKQTFRAALDAGTPDVFTVLAPTDDHLFVLEPDESGTPMNDRGRLVDPTGRLLWSGDHLAAVSGAAWSADGRLVVVAGSNRRWHLVRIDAAGKATDRTVALPFRIFLPTPLPTTDLSIPRVDPRTIPLGFSKDGRWAYGGIASPELGLLVATFRVAVDGSAVEPVADLGVGRADGLDPRPGTIGGRIVDPASGRIATFRTNPDPSGGTRSLEVRNPDAGFAFAVGSEAPIGAGWGPDGGLFVLAANAPLFADRVQLIPYGRDGMAGAPVLEMGPLASADLLGIVDGFAAMAASVTRPTSAVQLILVDLADPSRIAQVPLPDGGSDSIVGVEVRGVQVTG